MLRYTLQLAAASLAFVPLTAGMAQSTERGEPNGSQRMMESFGQEIPSDAQYEKMVRKAYKSPLGSKANPVRADEPQGQREYLSRLRCQDGSRPNYKRAGNVGPGVYGYIVDAYVVNCGDAAPGNTEIYMDMYHGGYVEQELVKGFYFEGGQPELETPDNLEDFSDVTPDIESSPQTESPPEIESQPPTISQPPELNPTR